jgi:hypothetical protein
VSVVRPALTYAAETRADTSKTGHILETIEMNTLRKVTGKRRIDHVRSQDIRQQFEIEPTGERVRKHTS